jgi:uncharacterized protein YecT (DUF1311 family)
MSSKHVRTPPRHVACLLVLAVVSASSTVLANESEKARYSKAYYVCIEEARGTTYPERLGDYPRFLALKDCTYQEIALQDKRLNSAYQKVMSNLSKQIGAETEKEQKNRLIIKQTGLLEVQRLWLQYSTAKCAYELHDDGSGSRLGGASCTLAMTQERADELEGELERIQILASLK